MPQSPCPPLDRLLLAMDDTARRTLDEHLREMMRMETAGRLASAMAHDFSNLLMVINGLGESLLERMRSDDPLRPDFLQLLDASERAAALATHLLAVSRRPSARPTLFDMDEVLRTMAPLIERLLGSRVRVTLELAPVASPAGGRKSGGKWVTANRDQFEHMLLNLATNARDAMPQGGQFTLRSIIDPHDPPKVTLTLTDTGSGMPPEVREHIFEPFFTTKPRGKGTGLGLWQAQTILAEHHGDIEVRSEHDRGTTFTIRLPLTEAPAPAKARSHGHY